LSNINYICVLLTYAPHIINTMTYYIIIIMNNINFNFYKHIFYRFKQLTYNNQLYWTNIIKWKWYQDKNKL